MNSDRQCRNCRYATKAPGHAQHYKVGLRNCAHLPTWRFVSGSHSCGKWQSVDATASTKEVAEEL